MKYIRKKTITEEKIKHESATHSTIDGRVHNTVEKTEKTKTKKTTEYQTHSDSSSALFGQFLSFLLKILLPTLSATILKCFEPFLNLL